MKINPSVRKERLAKMQELYDLIIKDNENYKEDLYKIIKKFINENKKQLEDKVTDAIYDSLENTLSITLKYAREMYKSFNQDKNIDLKNLLYNKDGKTLEERIHAWIEDENPMNLLYHFCLILDTETFQIIHQGIRNKINIEYVEVVGDGGCEVCGEYCDGELYYEDEIEFPPYHPGCMCEVLFYEKEDIIKEL